MPPAVEAVEAWSLNQQIPKEAPLITFLDLQRLSAAVKSLITFAGTEPGYRNQAALPQGFWTYFSLNRITPSPVSLQGGLPASFT